MAIWRDETTLMNLFDLNPDIPGKPSRVQQERVGDEKFKCELIELQYHTRDLEAVEEEILQHYKDFAHFCNKVCKEDPDAGKRFYDLDEAMYFDLMGNVPRPGFRAHYDKITPYLSDAQIAFKDMEVMAVTKTFGYVTALQRYWGTAADGNAFDFTFRTTSLLRKKDGHWKYIHEHFSFPVDVASKVADMTCGTDVNDAMNLSKEKRP